jgi:Ca2+-binding RTX toxin-like protein
MIEPLDPRRLMSVTLDPNTGVLHIAGTSDGDTIIIQETLDSDTGKSSIEVSVNENPIGPTSEHQVFASEDVKAIKVSGGSGPDTIDARLSSIKTTLDGGKGDDTLFGGSGTDKLVAGGGSNNLSGGAGGDLIVAGIQADTLNGDAGNDRFIPDNTSSADDHITGGTGFDIVDYSTSTVAVVAEVGGSPTAKQANDVIKSDIEQIMGSDFDDKITNATGHSLGMFGQGGNDTLTGGSGNDTLDGGSGHDSLVGNGGKDHFKSKDGETDTLDGGSKVDFIDDADAVQGLDTITNIP